MSTSATSRSQQLSGSKKKDLSMPLMSGSSSLRSWLGSGVMALADQAFVSLNTFVTMILVAQLCVRAELNLYALAWSILNVFRIIQERAVSAPYVVFAHEPRRNAQTFRGSSLVHQGVFSVAASVACVLLAAVFSLSTGPPGMSACMLTIAVVLPFILARDHLRAISCAHFCYGIAVSLSATAFLLQVVLVVAAYVFGVLNAMIVFAAMGISSAIPCLAWLVLRAQCFQFEWSQLGKDWQETFAYFSLVGCRPLLSHGCERSHALDRAVVCQRGRRWHSGRLPHARQHLADVYSGHKQRFSTTSSQGVAHAGASGAEADSCRVHSHLRDGPQPRRARFRIRRRLAPDDGLRK